MNQEFRGVRSQIDALWIGLIHALLRLGDDYFVLAAPFDNQRRHCSRVLRIGLVGIENRSHESRRARRTRQVGELMDDNLWSGNIYRMY